MKMLPLAAVAVLVAAPAFAQGAPARKGVAQAQTPIYARGSGTRAGGPAYLLISETGGRPVVTPRANPVPAYARGSGTRAGGPAYLLLSETGGVPIDPRTEFFPPRPESQS
ncbi:MAG TPA: hypothetical protein VM434_00210 [Beijerinckiaceae bacterium]|nr:hypothetical protein [Beijerinckiaceae bacterium]